MPTLARAARNARRCRRRIGPLGFLVGGNWVTIYTGTSPSHAPVPVLRPGPRRHVRTGVGRAVRSRARSPVAGVEVGVRRAAGGSRCSTRRTRRVDRGLNGVQLVGVGLPRSPRRDGVVSRSRCSTRSTRSTARICSATTDRAVSAPRAVRRLAPRRRRSARPAENQVAARRDARRASRRRRRCRAICSTEGDWDLFFTVFGESHCAGHQFWKMHDETHPWHDPEERRAARRRSVARTSTPRSTPHSANCSITPATTRPSTCTCRTACGRTTTGPVCSIRCCGGSTNTRRGTDRARIVHARRSTSPSTRCPRSARRSRAVVADRPPPPAASRRAADRHRRPAGRHSRSGSGERRWWMQPNDSVFGSVRLNLDGREPNGRICGDAQARGGGVARASACSS